MASQPNSPSHVDEPASLLTFRIFGFRVDVRASFLIVSFLFASAGGLSDAPHVLGWIALIFVSILWHELGHAFAARAFGSTSRIELHAGGGLTHSTRVDGWWKNLLISVAGPFAGLLLGAVVWSASRTHPSSDRLTMWLIGSALYVNVGWSLINLLPVLPYDGGQAFEAIVTRWTKSGKRIANSVSLLFASVGIVYALAERRLWIGYLAGTSAIAAYQVLANLKWKADLARAWDLWRTSKFGPAETGARAVIKATSDNSIKAEAIELVAWALVAQGKVAEVRPWLATLPEKTPSASPILEFTLALLEGDETAARGQIDAVDPVMFWTWTELLRAWQAPEELEQLNKLAPSSMVPLLPHKVAFNVSATLFDAGKYEYCGRISRVLYETYNLPDDAYNVACSECRLEHLDEAVRWFAESIKAGYQDWDHFESDEDLAPIRELPEVRALRSRTA